MGVDYAEIFAEFTEPHAPGAVFTAFQISQHKNCNDYGLEESL
jgi:hypothetical protein